jgi:hypothetical protein
MDSVSLIVGAIGFLVVYALAVYCVIEERKDVNAWRRAVAEMGAAYRLRAELLNLQTRGSRPDFT